MTSPTPLELLSLAHTRRTDPSLALSLAEQAGKEHDAMNKTKENDNGKRPGRR